MRLRTLKSAERGTHAVQIEEHIPRTTEPSDKIRHVQAKRSLYDHDKKMRTSSLQLYGCARKESLQRYMCRCEEDTRTHLPMQAPEVQRYRPQDVGGVTLDATASLESLRDVQLI